MSALPSWIVDLNSQTRLQRKSFSEAGLNESHLDKLVIDQRELLADVLIENDLIDEGAHLLYIGRKFHDIDILFAEVDEEDEPLRLVLVEDKLLKNPEAKRSVIGQIVEYAARFQGSVRARDLAARYPEHRPWVERNAELLDRQVELGDFLLVVCGDSIHSNVADIVTRLTRRADRHPMSGMPALPSSHGSLRRGSSTTACSTCDRQSRPFRTAASDLCGRRSRGTCEDYSVRDRESIGELKGKGPQN